MPIVNTFKKLFPLPSHFQIRYVFSASSEMIMWFLSFVDVVVSR